MNGELRFSQTLKECTDALEMSESNLVVNLQQATFRTTKPAAEEDRRETELMKTVTKEIRMARSLATAASER